MTITDRRSGSASASTASSRVGGIPEGLGMKAPVRVTTTANVALAGLQTIDGVTLVANDRILVKDQTTGSENGIYVASSGNWERAADTAINGELVQGTLVYVFAGSLYAGFLFQCATANPITFGSTSISFTAFFDIGTTVQAWDQDLDTISALSGTGILVRAGASSYPLRTITGTANEITLTNGDGVAGNPTVSLPAALTFTGKTITGGTYASIAGASFVSGVVLDFDASDVTITHSADALTLAGGVLVLPNAGLQVGASVPFSDAAGTLTLQNVDALDPTTESTIEAAIDTLANLTSIQGHTVTLTGAFVRSGAHSLTLTTSNTTNVTLPTTGTLATLAGSETLTNKVLTAATITTSLVPTTDDGAPLGDTTHNFSDLFLASGAVVNFAGDVTITHAANTLTFAGASSGYVFDAPMSGVTTFTLSSFIDLTEIASPSNPSADHLKLFAKDVGGNTHLFHRDSAGTEVDITNGAAGGLPAATQAEMEAATSTTVAATPGRTQYHPGVAKAWVSFDASSGTPTASVSHNVTSLGDNATGDATINFTTSFSSGAFTITGICNVEVTTTPATTVARNVRLMAKAAASARVFTARTDAFGTGEDQKFVDVVAFGDQ